MRDREQRLRWIEKLIGGGLPELHHSNALVIPTMSGNMAVAFDFIEEVVPAGKVRSLAFLPTEFCGVLPRGNELVPVVDTGLEVGKESSHVVIVRGGGCLLGLRFAGTPYVVDLDETKHALLEMRFRQEFDRETLPVLDIDAVVAALLATP